MAVDLEKLSFYSASRYERVALKSSQNFTVTGGGFGQTTVTIPHNLGYKPYYKAWYGFGSGKYYQLFAGTATYDIDGNGAQIDNVSVTTTDLIVVVDNFGVPAISGTIYYRIYAEPQS